MKNKWFIHIICGGLFASIILSGCLQQDMVIKNFEPYIGKIAFNEISLRAIANSIIRNCSSRDKECKLTNIYRYVVETCNYVSDPVDAELIQSPNETIEIRGGDCEDLTILLVSLLENIGIKTYLLLSENHLSCLVKDVNISNMWTYVRKTLVEQVKEDWGESTRNLDTTFVLKAWERWYYGGNGSTFENTQFEYMNITYDIDSTQPLDLYVVPSPDEYNLFKDGKPFTHDESYKRNSIKKDNSVCTLVEDGGIILDNPTWYDATINLNLIFEFQPSFDVLFENTTLTSYEIDNYTCIVLDPTAGQYGYPGYSGNLTGEMIAMDPVTEVYFYLG